MLNYIFFRCKDSGVLIVGVWLSLVERCVRDAEAGGSNPLAPTKINKPSGEGDFLLDLQAFYPVRN